MAKWTLCWIAAILAVNGLIAQESAKLTEDERKALVAERDRLWSEADKARGAGKLHEAIGGLEKVLTIERRVFGNVHAEVSITLSWMASWREEAEDFAGAKQARRDVLAIDTQLFGPDHWQVTNARLAVERIELIARLTAKQRGELAEVRESLAEAMRLKGEGQYLRAISLAEKVLTVQRRILGQKHPEIVVALSLLSTLSMEVGDFTRAEPLLRDAVSISKAARGERHPHHAINVNNLAGLAERHGDFGQAERLYLQSLAILKGAGSEFETDYATTLGNLGRVYREVGQHARAEERFREAIEVNRKALGEAHPAFAESLIKLAILYHQQNDNARAEAMYLQALGIKRKALGETHPSYLESLANVAHLYAQMGEHPRAEPLFLQVLAGLKSTQGELSPNYIKTLSNLAGLYERMERYREAERLYRQVLEIEAKFLGRKHPSYAHSLVGLAHVYQATGSDDDAARLFDEALSIEQQALGKQHWLYVATLTKLGESLKFKADYQGAGARYRQALSISLHNLDVAALGQSERQQLAMMADVRYPLDCLIALATQDRTFAAVAFDEVLKWKGMVLSRQRALRAASEQPAIAPIAEELRTTASRIAALSFATPPPDKAEDWKAEIARLTEVKEELEAKLAAASSEFRAARKELKLADLQAALPAGAAFIDFLVYEHAVPSPPGVQGPPRLVSGLAAFVVGRAGQAAFVDLGPSKPIEQAIDAWRKDNGNSKASSEAAERLRNALWLPVEKHLAGATTILLSPDGDLGKLPFAALPGKQAGTYLIEDYTLAVVPSPRAVVEMAARKTGRAAAGNLLVVADVNYDGRLAPDKLDLNNALASRAARSDGDQPFLPLPGTRSELATIRQLYQEHFGAEGLTAIDGIAASQNSFVREASRNRLLHIATHGYFAAARYKSALDRTTHGAITAGLELVSNQSLAGYHPGLLSGLAFAGANKPTESDDGILTAEEVRSLNLNGVELVVLSACETGLGDTAGGEGLLGLQRAFQAAGASSVVASLWNVPDEATKVLMVRFYENLWKRKMEKGAALREAQLWMLRHGAEEAGIRRELAARGLKEFAGDAGATTVNNRRLPPYFWAAFVLSGDWR